MEVSGLSTLQTRIQTGDIKDINGDMRQGFSHIFAVFISLDEIYVLEADTTRESIKLKYPFKFKEPQNKPSKEY